MKKTALLLICLLLLLGLTACGLLSSSEKPVSGKYYLTLLPDKKGKNTVEDVLNTTLRLKVGGGLVKTVNGEEEEGSWEENGRRITLRLKDEVLTGKVTEDRIEIGNAVYVRGLKEARDLWQADADAYVADPLAEYEGKYYLAGDMDENENRVISVDDVTLWLLADNEALLFEKGDVTQLSWNARGDVVYLQQNGERVIFNYQEGQLTSLQRDSERYFFRDKEEAEAFLLAHPHVPKPIIPVRSGMEGTYFLAYATAFGKLVDIGRAGAVRISLEEDYVLHYEGEGYSEKGSYEILSDGKLRLVFRGGYLQGSAQNGCLDFTDIAGDQFIFFDTFERAETYRQLYGIPEMPGGKEDPKETTPAPPPETEVPPAETTEEESAVPTQSEGSEEASFWQGTWYGMVRLNNNCSGLYYLMRGKCYSAYVVLSMREDGTGTMTVYDPAQTFGERLLSGTVRCGENKTLTLTEGLIEPFSVTIGNYSVAWDETQQMVTMSLTESVSGGSIGGDLYLRPWGQTWEDQPELMKQLPDYQAYLEEIQAGTPRYQ